MMWATCRPQGTHWQQAVLKLTTHIPNLKTELCIMWQFIMYEMNINPPYQSIKF